jgi:hypothetical protein
MTLPRSSLTCLPKATRALSSGVAPGERLAHPSLDDCRSTRTHSLVEDEHLTILTTLPVNPTCSHWLARWDVAP